jgi:hypothetical protein
MFCEKELHGMKKTGCLIILLYIVCIFTYAEIFTHEAGNLEMSLPDDWLVEPDEDMLFASSPDDEIFLMSWVVTEVDQIEAAIDAVFEEVEKMITDFETESEEEFDLNGLSAYMLYGAGFYEDIEVGIVMSLVDSGDAITILFFFGTENGWTVYEEDFVNIVSSISLIT